MFVLFDDNWQYNYGNLNKSLLMILNTIILTNNFFMGSKIIEKKYFFKFKLNLLNN